MTRLPLFAGALALLPALASADIILSDVYARSSNPKAGAAFMIIHNASDTADRLIGVRSDLSARTELHTHLDNGEGVLRMVELEDGIALEAGVMHHMMRGGDHVMFMGLHVPMEEGAEISFTLIFEQAGEVSVTAPVDSQRRAKSHDAQMGHGDH